MEGCPRCADEFQEVFRVHFINFVLPAVAGGLWLDEIQNVAAVRFNHQTFAHRAIDSDRGIKNDLKLDVAAVNSRARFRTNLAAEVLSVIYADAGLALLPLALCCGLLHFVPPCVLRCSMTELYNNDAENATTFRISL